MPEVNSQWSKVNSFFKTLGQATIDLVFPVTCLSCGLDGTYLCANCFNKIPKLEKQLCIICEKPSPYGKTHPECVSRNTVDGLISALPYSNPLIKKLIETFKYNFVSDLANPLTDLLIQVINQQQLTEYFQDFTIIPVPLHRKRFNWRGFNQAELLAEKLSEKLEMPIDKTLAQRVRFTKPQTELKKEQRKQNVTDAFTVSQASQGKYLLVDDVITTGATLNEIARLLKKSGATSVWAATVAHG